MARAPRAAARRPRAGAAPVAVPAHPQLLPRRARAGAHRRGRARRAPDLADRPTGRPRRSSAGRRCGPCSTISPGCPSCSATRCCGASSTALPRRARERARAHQRRDAQPRAPRAGRADPRRRRPLDRLHRRPPRHLRRLRPAPPADRPHAAPSRHLPDLPRAAVRAARAAPHAGGAGAARRPAGRARRDGSAGWLGTRQGHGRPRRWSSPPASRSSSSRRATPRRSRCSRSRCRARCSPPARRSPTDVAIVRARGPLPGAAHGRARLPRRPAPRRPAAAGGRTGQRALRGRRRSAPSRPRGRPDRGGARAREGRGAVPPPGRARARSWTPRACAPCPRSARCARRASCARRRAHPRCAERPGGEPVAVERREHGWARVLTDTGATGWLPEDDLVRSK